MFFMKNESIKKETDEDKDKNFLKEKAPIGMKFVYLGRPCIVMSHYHSYDSMCTALTYEYVDKSGVIHEGSFYVFQARALFELKG